MDVYSPPLALKQGQWIDWSCDYVNPEARNVAQGVQTTDEMCMFIGTYWPRSLQMDFCGPQFAFSAAGHPISHGTKNGADYKACLGSHTFFDMFAASSDTRYAVQSCVTELCPKVSARVFDSVLSGLDISTVTCN